MLRFFSMTLAAGTMFVGTAVSTLAADMAAPAEATYQAPNWTGFYVGVHGGMASGNMEYTELEIPVFLVPERVFDFGQEVGAYGFYGGFDYQFTNNWVAGLELGYDRINLQYKRYSNSDLNALAEIKSSYSASVRVGHLVTPETLLYGSLGYASTQMEAELQATATAKKKIGSVKAGIGAETFLFGNVTGRMEVTYVNGTQDFLLAEDFKSFDPNYLLVTAGLSYRFGAGSGAENAQQSIPAMQFSGFYFGGFGSFGVGQSVRDWTTQVSGTTGPYADQAFGGGAFAGYDFLINDKFVISAEADVAYVNAKFEDFPYDPFATGSTNLFGTLKATYALSARVGFVATPSTLIYAKGGLGGMVMNANEDYFALENGGTKTLSAYQVGAGIESALTEKLALRIEGLYATATEEIILGDSQTDQVSIKPSLLTGRIGLAYRF